MGFVFSEDLKSACLPDSDGREENPEPGEDEPDRSGLRWVWAWGGCGWDRVCGAAADAVEDAVAELLLLWGEEGSDFLVEGTDGVEAEGGAFWKLTHL